MSNEGSVCFPTHPNCLPPKALHGMQPPADGKAKDLGRGGRDRLCTQSLGSTVHFRILKFKPLVLLLVMSVMLPNLGTQGGLATAPSGAPGREAVGTEGCQPSLLTHPPFLLVSSNTHNLTICRGQAAR